MRYYLCILAILCMSATVYAGGMRASSHKPRSPLQVSIYPVQPGIAPTDIKPGDVVDLKIIGMTFTDADKLDINVELHGGVELLSGETSWTGPANKGEEKALLISVRAPKHGNGMIRARISMSPSSGASFAAEAEYSLGKNAQKKAAPLPEKKKDSKGREIREYRVN